MIAGRISASRTLTAGQRREIGRYEVAWIGSLPGLGIGTMVEVFQMEGMEFCRSEALKIDVRYWMPTGPRCLR